MPRRDPTPRWATTSRRPLALPVVVWLQDRNGRTPVIGIATPWHPNAGVRIARRSVWIPTACEQADRSHNDMLELPQHLRLLRAVFSTHAILHPLSDARPRV